MKNTKAQSVVICIAAEAKRPKLRSKSRKKRSCLTESRYQSLSEHHLWKKPQDRQCQDHEQSLLLSVVSQHNETQHKVGTAGSADSLKPGNYL